MILTLLVILNETKYKKGKKRALKIAESYVNKFDVDEVKGKTLNGVLGLWDFWPIKEYYIDDDITSGAPLKDLIDKLNTHYDNHNSEDIWLGKIDYWYTETTNKLQHIPTKKDVEEYYSNHPNSNVFMVALSYSLK